MKMTNVDTVKTFMQSGLSSFDPDGAVTINDTGAAVDFRIESDDDANMFFVDGSEDRIGIGTNTPSKQVEMVHATESRFKIRTSVTPDGTKIGGILDLQLGANGASGSGHADTQDGDKLGIINFMGQGTDYAYQGAGIVAEVETGDGTATRTEQGVGLQFWTADTSNTGYEKRWTIDQDGDLIPASTSHGIVLGSTSNTNANTLDDYEEGTFTATLTATSSAPNSACTATGDYTKVGNWVNFSIFRFANVDTTGASGEMRITGLPFTVGNSAITTNIATHQFSFDASKFQWAELGGSTTTISFLESQNNGPWTNWNITAGSGRYLAIAGAYRV